MNAGHQRNRAKKKKKRNRKHLICILFLISYFCIWALILSDMGRSEVEAGINLLIDIIDVKTAGSRSGTYFNVGIVDCSRTYRLALGWIKKNMLGWPDKPMERFLKGRATVTY